MYVYINIFVYIYIAVHDENLTRVKCFGFHFIVFPLRRLEDHYPLHPVGLFSLNFDLPVYP